MQRAILVVIFALSGCVTVSTVDAPLEAVSLLLTNAELTVVAHQEAKMHKVTPGDLGPGLIDSLTHLRGVDGPEESVSVLLARDLAGKLERDYSMRFHNDIEISQGLSKRHLDLYPSIPNALEISITLNHLGYRPTAWKTYQYTLYAQARISDDAGNVVWKKSCEIGGTARNEVLQFQRSENPDLNRQSLDRVVATAIDLCSAQLVRRGGI